MRLGTSKKFSTQIPGLDRVLRDGILLPPGPTTDGRGNGVDGLVILVKGKAGCGKSTLALQMAVGLAGSTKGKADYYTLEQDPENENHHFEAKLAAICPEGSRRRRRIVFNPDTKKRGKSYETPYASDSTPLLRALDILSNIKNSNTPEENAKIVVIDGLNAIPGDERRYVDFSRMMARLRSCAQFSIVVYEPSDSPDDDWIDYLVDMTITMEADQHVGAIEYLLHRLSVTKARYQDAALGWHQYKLRKEGIQVYPSIHFLVHRKGSMQQSYDESCKTVTELARKEAKQDEAKRLHESGSVIEEVLGRPLEEGSCTVLLGARGTFKSLLTLDFLFRGAHAQEPGLLVSLIDNKSTVVEQAQCPLRGLRRSCLAVAARPCSKEQFNRCRDHLSVFHQRPGCIAPAEFFHYLSQRLEYKKNTKEAIKRLVFWDLTQLEYRFPLFSDEKMFFPALVDLCKEEKVALAVMGSGNSALSRAASAVADNVVFCWRANVWSKATAEELKAKDNNIKAGANCLALYVDRTQGDLGREGKGLYILPVNAKGRLESLEPGPLETRLVADADEKIKSIVKFQDIPVQ